MIDTLLVGLIIAVLLYGLVPIITIYFDARADKKNYISATDEERRNIEKTMDSNPILRAHAKPLGPKAIIHALVVVAILLILITAREMYR